MPSAAGAVAPVTGSRDAPGAWSVGKVAGAHERHGIVRGATRSLTLLAALVYPAWGALHRMLEPGSHEPVAERLVVSGLLVLAVAASFVPRLQRHTSLLATIGYYAGSAHYMSIAARNGLDPAYLTGALLIVATLGIAVLTPAERFTYFAFTVASVAIVAAASHATMHDRVRFALAVATLLAALSVGTWRRLTIERAQQAEVAAARAALEQKIAELESAQRQVRQLAELLPKCMHCGRIREERQRSGEAPRWRELEDYLRAHTRASFTHAVCGECLDKHHPE